MKTYKLPSEVTIDVEHWGRGELLSATGQYCALGALCHAAGIPDRALFRAAGPGDLWLRGYELKYADRDAVVLGNIISTNDAPENPQRRALLHKYFAELGITLRFSDEYPL